MEAIRGNESGGDYGASNASGSGCTGAYQFSQGTWDAYAQSAAPDYVGVDPASAPPEVQDAVMRAKTEAMYDKYGGNFRLMAVEHYGGEGAADSAMSNGYISDSPEYYNGDSYPSMLAYADDIVSRMGKATGALSGVGGLFESLKHSRGVYQPNTAFPIIINPEIYQINQEDRPFMDKLEDSFKNMWYENGTIAAIRTALIKAGNKGNIYDSDWTPSQENLQLMDELLGDNEAAKNSVLLNSDNEAQFMAFLKTKKEDLDRQKRADETSFGIHSIIGGLAGMLLDPLNLIPFVGEEALVAKVGARLGSKALMDIGAKRIYQMAETGVAQGMINMADSYLSERYGINKANYAVAGVLGAAGGVGVRFLRTMKNAGINTDTPNMNQFITQVNTMETQAVRDAMDMGDAVSLSTHVDMKSKAPLEDAVQEFLGGDSADYTKGKAKRSKQLSKDYKLSSGDLPTVDPAAPAEALVGKKASKLLRRAGLPKDASVTDLLRISMDNPDIGRQVRKAAEKYHKLPISDEVWEKYRKSVLGEDIPVNKTQYAMEALTDSEKMNNIRLQLEKTTGTKVSNDDVRKTLKKILYRESGVTYTETGDIINDGVRIRKDTPLNDAITKPEIIDPNYSIDMEMPDTGNTVFSLSVSPEKLEKDSKGIISDAEKEAFKKDTDFGSKTLREVEKESQIGFKSRVMQFIGRKLQDTKYLGNTYGHFANSVSNHARDFARKFLADPRQNAGRLPEGMSMDVSTRKDIMQKDLKNWLGKMYTDCYVPYFQSHPGTPQAVRDKFGKQFLAAYDAKFKKGQSIAEYPKEIQQAVSYAAEFRKEEQWLLRKAGLLDEAIPDTGFYRNADIDKVADFLTHFDTTDDAVEWLAEYGRKNVDRTAIEEMWKKGLAKRQAELDSKLKAGKKVSEEEEEALATETLEDYIDREAHNWAYGIIDHNLSNSKIDMHDLNHMNKLNQYMRRFPVDTSAVADKELPDGSGLWSFDECMRDTDIFKTMTSIAGRSSAKAVMRSLGVTDIGKYFDEYRDKIYRELRQASENKKLINHSDVEDAMEEFDYIVSKLMGVRYGTKRSRDPMSKLGKLMTKLSYSMNGWNMGLNQINENVGLMSVTGSRAITHMIPMLDKVLQYMRSSTLTPEELNKLRISADYAHYSFLNPMNLTTPQLDRVGLRAKLMASANDAVDYAADATSMINRLSAWTSKAISMGEADVMSDLIDWAVQGKTSKLFSKENLKVAGIRDVDKFKSLVQKHFGNLNHDDPDAVFKAIQKMQEEDYASYVSMRAFSQQAVQRAILQPTLSNDNYFAKRGSLLPMLFQFKNFSRMALDSHLARALERPDKEVMTQLLSSAIAGAGIWALRTQVYANYKYKDEKERQKYLDETLTPDNFFRAGLTRSSVLAGLSYGNDVYELLTGSATVRTTVNRQGKATGIGDYINQLPSISSVSSLASGVGSLWSAINDLVVDNKIYQDDAKTMTQMFPIDKFVGTQAVMSGLLDMHKGQAVEEQFHKRPETKPVRNPVVQLMNMVGVQTEAQEKETKKKQEKSKKKQHNNLVNMNGRW